MVECMTVADTAARAQRYRPPPTAAPLVGLASCQHAKTRRSGMPKKGRARRSGNLVEATEVRMILSGTAFDSNMTGDYSHLRGMQILRWPGPANIDTDEYRTCQGNIMHSCTARGASSRCPMARLPPYRSLARTFSRSHAPPPPFLSLARACPTVAQGARCTCAQEVRSRVAPGAPWNATTPRPPRPQHSRHHHHPLLLSSCSRR
jgi:hypothetical protein